MDILQVMLYCEQADLLSIHRKDAKDAKKIIISLNVFSVISVVKKNSVIDRL